MENDHGSEPPSGRPKKYPWQEPGRYGIFRTPGNAYRRFDQISTLYFLGDDGPWLKIGLAKDLEKRLRGLQLGNPRLRCKARRTIPQALDRQIERHVHAALAHCAVGREWFDINVRDALKAASPILNRAGPAYRRMVRDGLFHIGDEPEAIAHLRLPPPPKAS